MKLTQDGFLNSLKFSGRWSSLYRTMFYFYPHKLAMTIQRAHISSRMSQTVVYGNTVSLAGQVADDFSASLADQTRQILARIDRLLEEVGSHRSKLLSVQIWLADISYFDEMNTIWDAWVDPKNPPARATCAVVLAHPDIRIEMVAVAAL